MEKIRTEIDDQENVRTHKMSGSFDVKELVRLLIELYTSPSFNPNMDSIWDLQDADFSSFSQTDINSIKEIVNRHWAKKGASKSAIIIGHDNTARMAQFYELILEIAPGKEVKRFTCYKDAQNWIKEGST